MEAAVVRPHLLSGDVAELVEDAADHFVGAALAAEDLELSHHAVESDLDAGDGVVGIAVTLAVQPEVAALEFLAVEIREQGHTEQGVHVGSSVSERQLPL
jgi:hypothetical protein